MNTDEENHFAALLDPAGRFASLGEINPITERIIGCTYAVSTSLGPGFLEKVYEDAIVNELRKSGLIVAQQQPISMKYDNIEVGYFEADIVVEGLVLIELKSGSLP